MNKRSISILTGSILTISLGACSSATPAFDQHFGATVPVLRAQQTANLNAPTENQNRSVEGMDGRAARETLDRYYRSFSEPPPEPPIFSIGLGEERR